MYKFSLIPTFDECYDDNSMDKWIFKFHDLQAFNSFLSARNPSVIPNVCMYVCMADLFPNIINKSFCSITMG